MRAELGCDKLATCGPFESRVSFPPQLEDLEVSLPMGRSRWHEWLLTRCSAEGQRDEFRFHDLRRQACPLFWLPADVLTPDSSAKCQGHQPKER